MNALIPILVGVALFGTMTVPTLATPNDHRYQRSLEAKLKQFQFDCQAIKNAYEVAEDAADANAGTPSAAKPAKDADNAWAAGQKKGCAWAS
jgi:hypothetical protein